MANVNVEIVTSQVSFTIGYASKPLADIPVEIASTTISIITNDGSNQVLTTRSQTGFGISDAYLRSRSMSSADVPIRIDNAANVGLKSTFVTTVNTTNNWFNYVGSSPDFLGNTGSINFTGIGANAFIPIGTPGIYDYVYDVPGTYYWTCPADVYLISAVCIGGGGGGNANWAASAGSGGGLAWKNDVTVTPGQQYYVAVGAGGTYGASSNAAAGGNSLFRVTPGDPAAGQYDQAFVTPGTYTWVCPAGITSVSVVAVGGGGGGGFTWSSGGGGGGGLGWKNSITVVPGQSYTVVVGAGGPSLSNATTAGSEGGNSYFIDTATVCGFGGGRGGSGSTSAANGYGGGFVGDGGGRGGNGAYQGSWNFGGAGAGGYSGAGADSGQSSSGTAAPTGSGAGAAAGWYSSTYGVPAGGGVGIYGRGADGAARGQYLGGGGGSGGGNGTGGEGSGEASLKGIRGGAYGGGGGGSGTSYGGGPGGDGAVRILAGGGRSFPITAPLTGLVIGVSDVVGYGGGNQTSGADTNGPNKNIKGGGYSGTTGGAGGHAADYQAGGGAGGYTGQGGNALAAGAGGGGAGGRYYSSTYGTGAGGGTGIFGLGTSGALNAANGGGGSGGSGGTDGASGEMVGFTPATSGTISGGLYGGGGGGPGTTRGGGNGGSGAVRIIGKIGSFKSMTLTANGYSTTLGISS